MAPVCTKDVDLKARGCMAAGVLVARRCIRNAVRKVVQKCVVVPAVKACSATGVVQVARTWIVDEVPKVRTCARGVARRGVQRCDAAPVART